MKWLLLLAMAVATFYGYMIPAAQDFQQPELARIVVYHLPCAFAATVFILLASVSAIAYLRTKSSIWAYRTLAANEMALALGCATMATGIVFSRVQWNAWWQWDPRQTSFGIVLLLLAAYFAVRMAYEEDVPRERASAVYAVLILLPELFLIFVFPRLPQVGSFHPSNVIAQQGGFSPEYWRAVMGFFAALLATSIWQYRMHVRTSILAERIRDTHGNLEAASGVAAPHRVDRSVPLQ